ncbi:MAG: methyltransferase regulatory domain-containing protein [Anaerolineae bacterium]|nr:methyltransferase regulatory domain-containing protein [Anaerolineae bacterium]
MMLPRSFPDHISQALAEMSGDVIEREQYMDFIRNRTLRQTLLCHQDISINRQLTLKGIPNLYIASRIRPIASTQDIHTVEVAEFRHSDGATLSTDHPVTKEAMLYLAQEWTRPVSFHELLTRSRSRLGVDDGDIARDAQLLAANLLTAYGYSGSLVELHAFAPRMVITVSERPVASSSARLQAKMNVRITNLRHERVTVDAVDRYLLPYLDGDHDLSDLVDVLGNDPVAAGIVALGEKGESTGKQGRDVLAQQVSKRLGRFARAALLVG